MTENFKASWFYWFKKFVFWKFSWMDIWNKKQILTVLRVCYNEISFFIQLAENEFKIHYILIIDQNTNPLTIEFKTVL